MTNDRDITKNFSETVFDIMNGNASDVEDGVFRDTYYIEWNGDDASIDFYPNVDNPHGVNPLYRLLCVDGEKPHPIAQWVLWCSNYPPNVLTWMKEVFPENPTHFYNKFLALIKEYNSDEAMNRFFRELSVFNQRRLIRYVMTKFEC